ALAVMGYFWLNATRDKNGVMIMTKARVHIRKRRFNFYRVAVAITETGSVHEAKDVFIKVRKENLHDPHTEERWHYIYHFLYSCSVAKKVNINMAHAYMETEVKITIG